MDYLKTVANLVTEEHLAEGRLYPPLTEVREISVRIATKIAELCYQVSALPLPLMCIKIK